MLPQDPIGRALVQMLARDRYERWLAGEIGDLLERALKQVVASLVTDYADLTAAQRLRRLQLYALINRQLAKSYGQAADRMEAEMKAFANVEARASVEQFRSLVSVSPDVDVTLSNLTRAEVKAVAEFPIAGLGIGEWFEKQANDISVAVRGQIQLGLLNGESATAIARRIVPQNATSPAVARRARANAETLVRTTMTTVQTQAAYESMSSIGPDLVPRYRYVAVRDGRTTPICRALDGQEFRFDDPRAKRPPQHPNCRSTIVAIADYDALGLPRPNTLRGGFTMGTYSDWLKDQPAASQDAILGGAGAKLFREGRATLAGLVTDDGRRMARSALEALYGVA